MSSRVIELIFDIETICYLIKTEESFYSLFKHHEIQEDVNNYRQNSNILSKNKIWGYCSTINNIPSINKQIEDWKTNNSNWKEIIHNIYYSKQSLQGKVFRLNKDFKGYNKVIKDLKEYGYNNIKMIESQVIKNPQTQDNSWVMFFS